MVEYNKIKYTELKKVVMSLNDSGVLKSNVRHVAVKGPQLYDDFISTIEGLTEEEQLKLPTDVIDFFNYAIDAEDETESELDFTEETPAEPEEDPEPTDELVQEEPDPEPIEEPEEEDPEPIEEPDPEPIEEPEEELIEDPEPEEETPEDPIEDPEPVEEPKEEPTKEPEPETTEEKPKMKRLSRTPMTAKVEEGVLTIAFNEIKKSKSFQLPDKDNLVAFKVVRRRAIEFAEDCNATKGQIAAVGKTLNMAGYYVR